MNSFYQWNEYPVTHSLATTVRWKYNDNSYDEWSNPIKWSWTWNENNPALLHDWQEFTMYLREGQWR